MNIFHRQSGLFRNFRKNLMDLNRAVPEDLLCELFHGGKTTFYPYLAFLQVENSYKSKIFHIKSGIVREFCTYNERELTDYFYFEGETILSYISDYSNGINIQSLQAITDCEVIEIDFSIFKKRILSNPRAKELVDRVSALFILAYHDKNLITQKASAQDKYLYLLENFPEYINKIKLKFLASYIDINIETLSRVRKKLLIANCVYAEKT